MRRALLSFAVLLLAAPSAVRGDVPNDLVVDVRLYEMRSVNPDFASMSDLSFFIDTDGTNVTEQQWLATLARQVPDAFLAKLAFESLPLEGQKARLAVTNRSRTLQVEVDLADYLARGAFNGRFQARFEQGDETLRETSKTIELRSGQTYVMSSAELELSASEYLSHFREYESSEHRSDLYNYLRAYTVFLIVAITPRVAESGREKPVEVTLPRGVELPELVSPAPVKLVGTIALEFDVDEGGVPQNLRIARSSIPEINPLILGAAETWRFPDNAGRPARLELTFEVDR
ncbi:MAG TPA: hypothetical protein VLK65_17170 [Vicinamibacteria bacterium]|nr:hypothetical protein [Vicinamibacteria bacterium]